MTEDRSIFDSEDELELGLRHAFRDFDTKADSDIPTPLGDEWAPMTGTADTDPDIEGEVDQAVSLLNESGRYRVTGELGRGGMGVVLAARDGKLGREVAIKVLREIPGMDRRRLESFIEEAQIAGQLEHPGIVPVHDTGLLDERLPYFTMKRVRGQTLSAYLAAHDAGEQELPRLLEIFLRISEAVAYAHDNDVIHRDLKPSNVMIGGFGEVLVMDWGLAKLLRRVEENEDDTEAGRARLRTLRDLNDGLTSMAGSIKGTPAYMPPEQARGEIVRLGKTSDVFALGAILTEILTGKPPYVADGGAASVHALARAGRLDEARHRLERCGAERRLVDLALDCLAFDPADRPVDAKAVVARLSAHLRAMEEGARSAEIAREKEMVERESESRRRRLALTLGTIIVAVAATAIWLWQDLQDRRAEQERVDEERRLAREQIAADERVRRALAAIAMSHGREDFRIERADAQWKAAFEDYGIPLTRGRSIGEIVEKIVASDVRDDLVQALEEWIFALHLANLTHAWRNLAEISERADPHIPRAIARRTWTTGDDVPPLGEVLTRTQIDTLRPESLLHHAVMRRGRHGSEEALPDLRAAQARHPDDFRINFELALALSETKDKGQESIAYFRACNAMEPDQPKVITNLAIMTAAFGDPEEAIRFARRASDLGMEERMWSVLGRCLSVLKRDEEAVPYLEKAIAHDPDDARAHYSMGLIHGRRRETEEALACYRRAADAEKHHVYFRAMAIALNRLRRVPEAREAMLEAVALNDGDHIAWEGLGNLELQLKNHAAAEAAFRRSIAIDRTRAFSRTNLASMLLTQLRVREARPLLEEVATLLPESVPAQRQLARLMFRCGEVDQALAHIEQAIPRSKTPEALEYYRIKYMLALGRYDDAEDALDDALEHIEGKSRNALENLSRGIDRIDELDPLLDAYVAGDDPKHRKTWRELQAHAGLVGRRYAEFRMWEALFKADNAISPRANRGYSQIAAQAGAQAAAGWSRDSRDLSSRERLRIVHVVSGWIDEELEHISDEYREQFVDACLRAMGMDPIRDLGLSSKIPSEAHEACKKLFERLRNEKD